VWCAGVPNTTSFSANWQIMTGKPAKCKKPGKVARRKKSLKTKSKKKNLITKLR